MFKRWIKSQQRHVLKYGGSTSLSRAHQWTSMNLVLVVHGDGARRQASATDFPSTKTTSSQNIDPLSLIPFSPQPIWKISHWSAPTRAVRRATGLLCRDESGSSRRCCEWPRRRLHFAGGQELDGPAANLAQRRLLGAWIRRRRVAPVARREGAAARRRTKPEERVLCWILFIYKFHGTTDILIKLSQNHSFVTLE